MEISGKVFIVTGAASGLGEGTARMLAANGGKVVMADLQEERGQAVAKEIGATFVRCDVSQEADGRRVVEAARGLGKLMGLVNCAGIAPAARTVGKTGPHPLDDFRKVIDLNLIATFNVARLLAWQMSTNESNDDGERGVIINTASIAAFEGQIGQVAYSAAKAGIAGMTFTMARDLGSLGISVNTIAPSLFATGLTAGIPDEFADVLTKDAAFPKRMGVPDEYARLAVSIIENPMLNGGTIRLDGGQRFAPK